MPATPTPSPIRVLLIDDDRGDAALVRAMLDQPSSAAAFEVAHVTRFSAAVVRLSRGGADVAVLASGLPDMHETSGVCDLCGLFPELPIVVLARVEDEALGLRAIRGGAQDYLVKGQVDRARLVRSILHAIERKRGQRRGMLATLDKFPIGVLMLDEKGRVFLSNRAGDEILAEADGLSMAGGFLRTDSDFDTARLRKAIGRATDAGAEEQAFPVQGLSIPRRSSRKPLSVMVSPVRDREAQMGDRRRSAVLFVSDPERPTLGTHELLIVVYGLTPSEARLTAELLQGRSVDAAAANLRINIHTARSQLKRVLEKTDTRRQGEMIRLLLANPAPLR